MLGPDGLFGISDLLIILMGGTVLLAFIVVPRLIKRKMARDEAASRQPPKPEGWRSNVYDETDASRQAEEGPKTGSDIIACEMHRLENCPWCSGEDEDDEDDDEDGGNDDGKKTDKDDEDDDEVYGV